MTTKATTPDTPGTDVKALQRFATQIRLETVKEFGVRGFGHVGGSLSVCDVLAVLYGKVMRIDPQNPGWKDRDKLVLSKGHAGPALYATLALKGYFPLDWLTTLNQPGTRLPSHCDRKKTPGVDMTTGSLGQGVSTAIGLALAQQMDGNSARTYLVTGDGELNEGQCWEGALFAANRGVANLTWFVDYNRKQLDGATDDVMGLGDVGEKFAAFGWHVQDVDGGDVAAIARAAAIANAEAVKPSCIILNTIKGAGVPEVEAIHLNHHIVFEGDMARRAVSNLERELAAIDKGDLQWR